MGRPTFCATANDHDDDNSVDFDVDNLNIDVVDHVNQFDIIHVDNHNDHIYDHIYDHINDSVTHRLG